MPENGPPDDDASLFRDAIGPVRELPRTAPPPARRKPAPTARMAAMDDDDARSEFRRALDAREPLDAGDGLSYRREGVTSRTLRRLARGEYAAQDELDLHRATAAHAETLLRQFLTEARDAELGCVRIVHGKGLNSEGLPVLKNLVDRMLRHRADVQAFHSAPPRQGGTGAVLVLLGRPRAEPR